MGERWLPTSRTGKCRKVPKTHPQMLSRNTGIGVEDLSNVMLERDLWETVV